MAHKPLGLCFYGVIFLIFVNCHLSLSLESNSVPQFAVFAISIPADSESNGTEGVATIDSDDYEDFVPDVDNRKLNVQIQVHDVNRNLPTTTTERPSFSGIREKMETGSASDPSTSENPRISINLRGRSGVVMLKDRGMTSRPQLRQKTMRDGHITWDQAYDSSVKRVVVGSRLDGNVVPHNRNVVRFLPIVPKVTNSPQDSEDDEPVTIVPASTSPPPPPHEQVAKMARFIVRNSNWTSLATISSRSPITGFPFANIFSVSDGTPRNSSGVPYMYMTPLDVSVEDLKKNVRSSLTMSLAQGSYCKSHGFDPEDPRCAHVILTGSIVELQNGTSESEFARQALFNRHPDMESWPKDHGWFFAKLEIANILVLDYFGGAKSVALEDYFSAGS